MIRYNKTMSYCSRVERFFFGINRLEAIFLRRALPLTQLLTHHNCDALKALGRA